MIKGIVSFFSGIPRGITTTAQSIHLSVPRHKATVNPVKTSSPFSPGNNSVSATTLFTAKNPYPASGAPRPASSHRTVTEQSTFPSSLPDVAQRLLQHLAEHGIKPDRTMAEYIPPAPDRPAPPPPVLNGAYQPNIGPHLRQHPTEHGAKPGRTMAEYIPPAPNRPAPPPPVLNGAYQPNMGPHLRQHPAEHGAKPGRTMAEYIPPAPNRPAPPPPVLNGALHPDMKL
ncbi:EspF repeat-containing protein [Escherichia albertii]|uniref:EspF repeat-containing protein n=1 Tax=Escherichia albertii TaxID=208962 RepID=UPI00235E5131|nr:EspF repeat-containing protein [Escherichia albertii]WDC15533.1 EspF repeat-containing protein [Escherichia albertii]